MIIMDLKASNLLCFNDFHINMSYPKKIVNNPIDGEFLEERSNFRYKKVNIIMGGNATGKTSLGKLLKYFTNYFRDGSFSRFTAVVDNPEKEAYLYIDFEAGNNTLYRFLLDIAPSPERNYDKSNVQINILAAPIGKNESYEMASSKFGNPIKYKYISFNNIDTSGWNFTFPSDYSDRDIPRIEEDDNYLKVLETVLKTLDPAILKVEFIKELESTYVIRYENSEVLIQNGELKSVDRLSSGTRSGLDIAYIIASLLCNRHSLYYCDEIFSYVNSDLEKACLSVMIDKLEGNKQLFFTTHNTDILELNLPKHAFTFLKKTVNDSSSIITTIYVSDYLKKADESLKNAVENDLFCTAPDLEKLYDLVDLT